MDELTGKRGRGRPRKTEKTTTEQSEANSRSLLARRGSRKRTAPADSTPVVSPPGSENIISTEKRGRGRPPGKTKKTIATATENTATATKKKTKTAKATMLIEKELVTVETIASSESSTPATSPSIDGTDCEQPEETILSTPNSTENDLKNKDNGSSTNGNDTFMYDDSDTNNDDFITGCHKNIEGQNLEVNDDRHLPTSRYSSTQNQPHSIIRSVNSHYLYFISKYIIPFALILFIFMHYIHFQATLRSNGYCDSMHGNNGGMTALGTTSFDSLKQSCIPCPINGICSGGELSCPPPYCPYRSIPNRLRNFVWPTGQNCIKDPILVKHVMKMERIIIDYLAQRQGEQQCREYLSTFASHNTQHLSTSFPLVKIKVASMMENLKHSFDLSPAHDQDYPGLDYLTETALDLVIKNEHVFFWNINGEIYLGTDTARYSFWCWCWTSIYVASGFLKKALLALVVCLAFWFTYCQWKKRDHDAKVMTVKALEMLWTQRQRHLSDPHLYDPGCSANYLWTHITMSTAEPPIGIWNCVLKRLEHHPSLNRGYIDNNGKTSQYFEYAL